MPLKTATVTVAVQFEYEDQQKTLLCVNLSPHLLSYLCAHLILRALIIFSVLLCTIAIFAWLFSVLDDATHNPTYGSLCQVSNRILLY